MLKSLPAPFNSRRGQRPTGTDSSMATESSAADVTPGRSLRLRDYFTLRPYGRSLITPAVSVWLGSAWIVILLMATIEGFVWGAVGASLVPSASRWLAAPVAGFMFLLMFSIVWIVDSSLIMSERPALRLRRLHTADQPGIGPTARWFVGLLMRVGIVAISLYVTAPFIEKLIRADDIAGWHQARVEQYFKDRDATIQNQVNVRAQQMDAGLTARIDSFEQEIARLSETLQAERARRARIEAEYAPEIEVLTRDLAEARARVGDEVLGRDGRPEGYGPEARKWDARVKLIQEQLAAIQAELDTRVADIQTAIDEQQERLAARSDALEQVRVEQAQLIAEVTDKVTAEQPPPAPPRLTFAARSKALSALRNSPDEAGVPHFETVEGFAQAALGILFLALIALKLFEPTAVHAYYSETAQFQYRKYVAGGLSDIPGFAHHDDPVRRLSPAEFYRLWDRYERDPDAYFEQMQRVIHAETRMRRLLADQKYDLELLERQRQDIDDRLSLERRRREAELTARERELDMELQELRKRAAGETIAELERLQAQRDEVRQAHSLEMENLAHRFAAERDRLDQELEQRRAEWEQQRRLEEEQLRREREAFEDSRQSARDEVRLRQMALDDQRRLREKEVQQAGDERTRAQQRADRELRIEQTRALIADEREVQMRQRKELAGLRDQLARCKGEFQTQRTELSQLREQLADGERRRDTLRHRIDEAALATDHAGSIWPSRDPIAKTLREARRQLGQVEAEREQLRAREQSLQSSLARLETECEGLQDAVAAVNADAASVDARIEQHRQRLDSLLLARD
jgi:hypothetical protein